MSKISKEINRVEKSQKKFSGNKISQIFYFKVKTTALCLSAFILLNNLYADNTQRLVEVSPKDIMFLAHFNNDIKPEIGNVDGMAYQEAVITSGKRGFAFKNSSPRAECLNVSSRRPFVAFPGAGNIDIHQGTLQFWLKPMWKKGGYGHRVFFRFHNNPEKRNSLEWRGKNSFIIQKPPKKEQLRLAQAERVINRDVLFGSIWHQIAVTWSTKTKHIKFYVDGELVGTKRYLSPDMTPKEIIFGMPVPYCSRALIDEARIIKRLLSDSEIKQDYLAQKAGVEFSTPTNKTASSKNKILKFAPEMPSKSNKSKLKKIILPASYTVKAPFIDADLNEDVWKAAPSLPEMLTRTGKPAKIKTDVKLIYDNKNIYIGATINEPQMNTIVAQFDQRDLKVYNDDCLEFVIKIPGSDDDFYHFAVNSLGCIYDSRAGSLNYNAKGAKRKTKRLKDKWILEMSIPFDALNTLPPQPGTEWGARFCRERHNIKTEYSSIPATESGGFSAQAFMGKLQFKGSTGKKSVISGTINEQSFMPGVNKFCINLNNRSSKSLKATINVNYFNNKNALVNSTYKPIDLKPGKQTVDVSVKVTDDDIKSIGINIKITNGEVLYNTLLQRGFVTVQPSIKDIAAELPDLKNNMRIYNDVYHPIYQDVVKALNMVDNAIAKYQEKLNIAVKSGRTVSLDECNKVIAVVKGFNNFRKHRRYLLWKTSPWEKGSTDVLPPVNYNETPTFTFNQAGNEHEPVCFIISGLLCGKRLDLRIVPHPVKKGTFISGSHFTVYTEPFLNRMGKLITSALIKAPGNIVTITPGHAQRIWIVFNSKDVPPGNYKTKISIKPLNMYSIPNREVPVSLKIFNFTLPETQNWPLDCYFWKSNIGPLDDVATLKMLHNYHIKWAMTEQHNYTHGFKKDGYQIIKKKDSKFDPEKVKHANQEFFETAKKLKMKIIFSWGTPYSVEWHKLMIKRLKGMGFTYKDFIFHGGVRDEFKYKDILRHVDFRRKMHLTDNKAQFMATLLTTPPPSGATFKQIEDAGLLKFFKVWAVISSAKPELFERLRKYNRTLWKYRCWLNMQTRSILDYYRFLPWQAYMEGLDGAAFWVFSRPRGDDGFDHRDGYDDGIALVGIDHKPIPSKQLMAVCKGLEDVAYMDILKKSLINAKKLNPGRDYSKYQKLLKEVPEKIMRDKSQTAIDNWRVEVAKAIEKLKNSK